MEALKINEILRTNTYCIYYVIRVLDGERLISDEISRRDETSEFKKPRYSSYPRSYFDRWYLFGKHAKSYYNTITTQISVHIGKRLNRDERQGAKNLTGRTK